MSSRFPRICFAGLISMLNVLAQPSPPVALCRSSGNAAWRHCDRPVFLAAREVDPEVRQYLEAENAYTAAMTKDLQPFQDALYKEMLGRIKQTDLSVPTPRGGYFYYSRTEEGKQYPIQCRRKGSMEAPEEVLLDLNELGKDQKFVGLGGFVVSDDQNLLAYTIDYTGFRQYALHVKDLRTGETLPDTTERVTSHGVGRRQQDAVPDHRGRGHQAQRQAVAPRPRRADVRAALRREGRALRHRGRQDARPEVSVPADRVQGHHRDPLPARRPAGRTLSPSSCRARRSTAITSITAKALFYIRTNKSGSNFAVMTAPENDPAPKNWKVFIAAPRRRADRRYRSVQGFRRFGGEVAGPRPPARAQFQDRNAGPTSPFPEPVYSVFPGGTPDYESHDLPLQLPEPDHASERLRLRHAHRQIHAAEAAGSARRLRSQAVRERAPVGHRARRREGADLHRLQEGLRARRQGAAVPVRLRLLRLSARRRRFPATG